MYLLCRSALVRGVWPWGRLPLRRGPAWLGTVGPGSPPSSSFPIVSLLTRKLSFSCFKSRLLKAAEERDRFVFQPSG